jgi:hypothetical protein
MKTDNINHQAMLQEHRDRKSAAREAHKRNHGRKYRYSGHFF